MENARLELTPEEANLVGELITRHMQACEDGKRYADASQPSDLDSTVTRLQNDQQLCQNVNSKLANSWC